MHLYSFLIFTSLDILNAVWTEENGLRLVGTNTIYAMQFHEAQLR